MEISYGKLYKMSREKGEEGLKDLSYVPKSFPNITAPEIEKEVLKMKKERWL